MRYLELLTERPFETSKVYGLIKENFKVATFDEKHFFVGKYPNTIGVYVEKKRMFSDCEYESDLFGEEDKGKIPIENAYRTDVTYHQSKATKKLVEVLLKAYPELCIYDNDEDELMTAKEYLDKEQN